MFSDFGTKRPLVYDPQRKAMLPKSYPIESKHPRSRARPSFRIFEKPSSVSSPRWRKQVPANLWLTGWFLGWHAK